MRNLLRLQNEQLKMEAGENVALAEPGSEPPDEGGIDDAPATVETKSEGRVGGEANGQGESDGTPCGPLTGTEAALPVDEPPQTEGVEQETAATELPFAQALCAETRESLDVQGMDEIPPRHEPGHSDGNGHEDEIGHVNGNGHCNGNGNGHGEATLAPPEPDAREKNDNDAPEKKAPASIPPAERRQYLGVGKIIPRTRIATSVKLSVVIPMFNEEENIQRTVDQLGETLREFNDGSWEVILVNDGSTDNTWERALLLAGRPEYSTWLRVVGYSRNRGRGFALRTGFAAARGEWIASTDADLSYEPRYILDLVKVLREEEGVDMVIASAYMPGGGVEGLEYKRLLVSKLGNQILSWFMSPPKHKVHTITCVFRAYRRYVLDSLELESDGKDLHLEILSKAIMLGYHFKEVPVTLRVRKHGKSKHVLMPTATSHLVFALFERPILVFGIVGLLLMISGVLGMGRMVWIYLAFRLDPVNNLPLNPDRPMMTIIVLSFLGGLQLLSFGVIGTQFVNLRKEIVRIQARLKSLVNSRNDD